MSSKVGYNAKLMRFNDEVFLSPVLVCPLCFSGRGSEAKDTTVTGLAISSNTFLVVHDVLERSQGIFGVHFGHWYKT